MKPRPRMLSKYLIGLSESHHLSVAVRPKTPTILFLAGILNSKSSPQLQGQTFASRVQFSPIKWSCSTSFLSETLSFTDSILPGFTFVVMISSSSQPWTLKRGEVIPLLKTNWIKLNPQPSCFQQTFSMIKSDILKSGICLPSSKRSSQLGQQKPYLPYIYISVNLSFSSGRQQSPNSSDFSIVL